MGWDRGYYYRSKKVGGKPRRVYVGKGPIAEAMAEFDSVARQFALVQREAWKAERREIEALDSHLDELSASMNQLAAAALVATGYRQHHRGEWRLQRGQSDDNT